MTPRPVDNPVQASELEGLSFRCLEGCGFCCTFPPEVAKGELARLRARFPSLPLVRKGGVQRLALQGGCGACTLLSRRACTAYAERPAHCRYFPFHVYFGRRTEVYVDRSCRGVEETRGANLTEAFRDQVQSVAPPDALQTHEAQAARVHATFQARARAAGVWGDVDLGLAAAVEHPWFGEGPSPARWEEALEPFAARDIVDRPFYLDAGLRWLTVQRDGGRLQVLEMQEDGRLTLEGTELRPAPRAPPEEARAGLAALLRRLARRDVMAGQAFDLVDAADYRLTVERAARQRVAQVAADLAVRVQVLEALGIPANQLAGEAERFYDAAFLDAPTIGGWL